MPKTLICECGECTKCRHRDYMRRYYHERKNAAEVLRDKTYGSRSSGGKAVSPCSWCGREVETTVRMLESGKRFCSRACKDAARQAKDKQARLEAKSERACRHCGGTLSKAMRSDAVFCSERCNSAAHGLKRGNGRVGPGRRREIERAYIISRDQGRCHICGARCRPDEVTLDHLIPLAEGGTHAPENLRVAHLSCNTSKGAREANDQLMLVG